MTRFSSVPRWVVVVAHDGVVTKSVVVVVVVVVAFFGDEREIKLQDPLHSV